MEVELFSNVLSEDEEEDTVEVDADYDNLGTEGERCGICMDAVVDRGVLDCCQHWFCFVCIDNWATITNLCPLCQNEFQLITCVPVFDAASSGKNDQDSDSRDDEWCDEGKNSTVSFPSYYIDENAVTCLDGDDCKIRSGSVPYEERLTLDTSIACDSCDIWYHAFCVGFDPEGTDVDSWLCPRCLTNEAHQKSDLKEMYSTRTNADTHHLVDTSAGKVSICVADTGETALVVSRIVSEDVASEPIVNSLFNRKSTDNHEVEQSLSGVDCSSEMQNPLDEGINSIQLETMVSFSKFKDTVIKSEPDDSESRLSLDLGQPLSNLSDGKANLLDCNEFLHDASSDENFEDLKADIVPSIVEKRKRQESSFQMNEENEHHQGRLAGPSSTKKVKAKRGNDLADIGTSVDFKQKNKLVESSAEETNGNMSVKKKKKKPIDIMSIVQGTELRAANKHIHQKESGKSSKVEKNAAGLRVKKIMRRPSEDKESDAVVQKLKKEIREAVQKKPSGDIGKSIFDPSLLAAFRAAVAGSSTEPAKNMSSVVKAKKLMLQKGKARENLTKKIYATSSGKRRRAWDRDCAIEFWKHRCMRTSKPEKIETLRSVLNLLKWNPDARIGEQTSLEDSKAPILSRLYLADTSLFPRKDDIKPLSVLKAAAASSNQNVALSSGVRCVESSLDKCNVNTLDNSGDPAQSNISSVDDKKKDICTSTKNGVASGKLYQSRNLGKASPQKKSGETNDVKIDKRKWALEVLARKTASNATSSMHQKRDDSAFKGNYPLLAELPTDMRPKLANTRQNKIPISVRQAQLYRLTEHFLKMTNLSSMHRTAATELAVADAINIEKQVADRSHSKAVYLNLCSQEIRNHTNCSSGTQVETSLSQPIPIPVPKPAEGETSSIKSIDSEAEEALRAAGLLSDSPPSSPIRMVKYSDGSNDDDDDDDDNLLGNVKEEVKSIFEMDCQPELDIYGDFEYDLAEDDYMGATSVNASNAQVEEGESKVKVVFSTLSSVRSDNIPEAKEQDLPETDTRTSLPSLLGCPIDAGSGSLLVEDKVDVIPPPRDNSLVGEGEELSVAECEELYGPDKEPSAQVRSDFVPVENSAFPSTNNVDISTDANKVTNDVLHRNVVRDNSSNCSEPKRKAEEEKNNYPKVDKKSELAESVLKKVEAYIKEHIRPLCKSGVITVEQYRWAVGKTSEKVMKHHSKAKNANFLIKEGEKVKKLAEQYIETAKHKEK